MEMETVGVREVPIMPFVSVVGHHNKTCNGNFFSMVACTAQCAGRPLNVMLTLQLIMNSFIQHVYFNNNMFNFK